jgi:hypothetical protein
MVRSVVASGGSAVLADDIYVRRLPPTTAHFLSQRIRQAYDEWARPARLLVQLALLPAAVLSASRWPRVLPAAFLLAATFAELGRRKAGGESRFSPLSSLMAPFWLAERMVCAWVAVGARLLLGGVRYHGVVIREPATSMAAMIAAQANCEGGSG